MSRSRGSKGEKEQTDRLVCQSPSKKMLFLSVDMKNSQR